MATRDDHFGNEERLMGAERQRRRVASPGGAVPLPGCGPLAKRGTGTGIATGYGKRRAGAPLLRQLLPIAAVLLAGVPAPPAAAQSVTCADRPVMAGAVSTRADIQSFVQCAYEHVSEVGFEAAHTAFKEEPRWKSGSMYVFVAEVTTQSDQARVFVFPPDPAREIGPFGAVIDAWGNDVFREYHRLATGFGEGWVYYSFTDPATGDDAPKVSYVKRMQWNGVDTVIGAGLYSRDLPGTCGPEEVNATLLDAEGGNERLAEFVRCAALELEPLGYNGAQAMIGEHRWRSGSIYLFAMDTYGNVLFNGDPYHRWFGASAPELNTDPDGQFLGYDIIRTSNAFGEAFLAYRARNPATGSTENKVAFVKRVVAYGMPMLLASGYYPSEERGIVISIRGTGPGLPFLGTVRAEDTVSGLQLTPSLIGLSPGPHGFHVHTIPDCGNGGMNTGSHYDPENTGRHDGPYGTGHLGALPVLVVSETGVATVPVVAPRLTLSDIEGRALIIHAGGDNYSDFPAPLGGGGPRVACGVIPTAD